MAVSQDKLNILVELQDKASAQLKSIVSSLGDVAKQSGTGAKAVSDLGKASNTAAKAADGLAKSHAGVNRELLVLAHELSQGQFTRFGGSLLVLGEQTNALGKAFQILALGGGVVGAAIGAVAVVAGATALAYYQAAAATKEFNNAMALTNNFAGFTKDSYDKLADTLSLKLTESFGKAREQITGLAASGQFSGDQIAKLVPVIKNFATLSGQSFEDVAKSFQKLGENPAKFAEEFNKATHIFTPAVQEQIRALEAQGRQTEATNVIIRTMTDYQNGPGAASIKANTGLVQEFAAAYGFLWRQIKLAVGAEKEPLDVQLKGLNAEVDKLQARIAKNKSGDQLGSQLANEGILNDKLAERGKILKQMAAEQKKQITDTNAAFVSGLAQDNAAYAKGLGVKSKQGLDEALANLKTHIRDAELVFKQTGFKGQLLDPKFQEQARAKIIKDNTNPIDDAAAKRSYQEELARQDGLIKIAQDYYALKREYAKVELDKGEIDQEQYDKLIKDLRQNDLRDFEFYTAAKVKAAEAEAKRTRGQDGVKDQIKFAQDIKHAQDLELLNNAQYEAALAKHAKAVDAINRKLADDISKSTNLRETQVDREFNKATLSSNEASLADAQNAVSDRFDAFRDRIREQLTSQRASAAEIKSAMDTLDSAQADSLQREESYAAKRVSLQRDTAVGFIKTYKDIQEAAANSAQHASDFLKSVTSGFEDFLTTFAETGKLSFKALEQTVTSSISKIIAQILIAKAEKALLEGTSGSTLGAAGSFFGALFGSGKATGGPVDANTIYPVGEKGPELFMPKSAGTIIPNHALGGGVTQNLYTTIQAVDAQSFIGAAKRVDRELALMHKEANRKYNI